MLTEEQRILFSKIVDLNWEYANEKNNTLKFERFEKLNVAKSELKISMGADAYNSFMEKGMKMFA